MTTMLLWLLVAVALAFVISGVTMWFIARLARRRLPEAMEAASRGGTDTLRVAPMAQFYGVVSAGRGQLRGDGVLILTADEVRFDLWSPERRLVIPLAAVLHVDTTKRHAGRYSVKPLLRVTWRDAHGLEDAAAWALTERDEWAQAIDDAARAARTSGGDSLPQAERPDRRLDHEEGR